MYRQTAVSLHSPTSGHLSGETYQEANEDPKHEWRGNAIVTHTSQATARGRLGEAANNIWQVIATLPRDVYPEPGWEVHAEKAYGRDRKLHVIGATPAYVGRTWTMNCEERGRPE